MLLLENQQYEDEAGKPRRMHRSCGEREMELKGRTISRGVAEAEALVTTQPISFYGGVDPNTSEIIEKGHELQGKKVKDKILVFPNGKGSTVGSYTLYRMKKGGNAPAGIVNRECETVVAVGAIISEIPCVDKIDVSKIKTGDIVRLENGIVTVKSRE
jgi:predicted aconitase with swiveling domain